jgi:hypothetical protein
VSLKSKKKEVEEIKTVKAERGFLSFPSRIVYSIGD